MNWLKGGPLLIYFLFWGCNLDPGFPKDNSPIQIFFTEPGQDYLTGVDKQIDRRLVDLIGEAEQTVDIAVFNFSRINIIDALVTARDRGVRVRFVGDIDEVLTQGYQSIIHSEIEYSLGNSFGIQHNKFVIVDKRYLFAGTGNISDSGFINNDNNFVLIDDEAVSAHFTQEFEQMFHGQYAHQKRPFGYCLANPNFDPDNSHLQPDEICSANNSFVVGDTKMEIFFSPYEGDKAMQSIINAVDNAQHTIHYMIFAFTHDELASALIRAARRGVVVQGVHDNTFVSGTSMEAPRLFSAGYENHGGLNTTGPFVRRDGNEHTAEVGNAGHGGKLHCKTLLIDAGTQGAVSFTGSFNWSSNAIHKNDENLMVFYSKSISATLLAQWQNVWDIGFDLLASDENPEGRWHSIKGHSAQPGEVIVSEVNWAGLLNGDSGTKNSGTDFIEVMNRSGRTIDLSHWVIQWGADANRNHYPIPDTRNDDSSRAQQNSNLINGATKEGAVTVDQNRMVLYAEDSPGFDLSAHKDNPNGPYLVKIAGTKNFRLDGRGLKLRLYDKHMTLIDEVGNGGPPFAGQDEAVEDGWPFTVSMQRYHPNAFDLTERLGGATDGRLPSSWYSARVPALGPPVRLVEASTLRSDGALPIAPGQAGWGAACKPGFNYAYLLEPGDGLVHHTLFSYNNPSTEAASLLNVQLLNGESSVTYDSSFAVRCYQPDTSYGPGVYNAHQGTLTLHSQDGALFPDPQNVVGATGQFGSGQQLTRRYAMFMAAADGSSELLKTTYQYKQSPNVLGGVDCSKCVDGQNYVVHFLGALPVAPNTDYAWFNRATPLRVNAPAPPPLLVGLEPTNSGHLEIEFNQPMQKAAGLFSPLAVSNYTISAVARDGCPTETMAINSVRAVGSDPARYRLQLERSLNSACGYMFEITSPLKGFAGAELPPLTVSVRGASAEPAQLFLSALGPQSTSTRSDFIRLQVVHRGNMAGIKVMDFINAQPYLIYAFDHFLVEAGDEIVIHVNDPKACPNSEGSIYAPAKDSCRSPSSTHSRWDMFALPPDGLSNEEGAVFLARGDYSQLEGLDFVCYSNVDGDMPSEKMAGLAAVYEQYPGLWSFSEAPLDTFNDLKIQKQCVDFASKSNSQILVRGGSPEQNSAAQWSVEPYEGN